MTESTTPANWYPDPTHPAMLRYWDGLRWTEHTAPAVAPLAPKEDLGPSNALHYVVPVGRSFESVLAPYIGLFAVFLGLIPFVGLALVGITIWLGIAALRKAKKGGHGTGRAITALVFAAIGLVISVASTLFLFGAYWS